VTWSGVRNTVGSPGDLLVHDQQPPSATNFIALAPQLLVSDVVDAVAYYREMLGFDAGPLEREAGSGTAYLALIRREGAYVQLRRGATDRRASNRAFERDAVDLYFLVRNLDAIYEEFTAKQVKVLVAPRSRPYPMREFEIEDCNGYVLTFGQPVSRPGETAEKAS
jgi:hypothetical protein